MKTPQKKSKKVTPNKKKSTSKIFLKSILVPIDFSLHSEIAIKYSISFAKQFNATIELIHVVEPMVYAGDVTFNQASFPVVDIEYKKRDEEKLYLLIEDLKKEYKKISFHSAVGVPFHEILSYAEEKKSDLIIMTTHSKSGFENIFFGSTSAKILRKAHCPILFVRSDERNFVK